MVTGVKGSELVSDLLEGKQQKVPVGRRVVYHEVEKNDKTVLPQTAGQELTHLHVSQFDAFGPDRESLAAKRTEVGDEVDFVAKDIQNDGLVEEAAFSDTDGKLTIVRRNGTLLEIDGFLTQSDFGTGKMGPRGDPGNDGDDAYDGDDGKAGGEGCPGEEGKDGAKGVKGAAGADGPQGVPGPIGGPGEKGAQGLPGPVGRFGHEGSRGRKGPDGAYGPEGPTPETDCSDLPGRGAEGDPGLSPNFSTVITAEGSEDVPDSFAVLWGVLLA